MFPTDFLRRKSIGNLTFIAVMGCVTTVDVLTNRSTLISSPNGMDAHSAAASAYVKCATSGANFDEKWFCCSYCKKGCVPVEQHVGGIFDKKRW